MSDSSLKTGSIEGGEITEIVGMDTDEDSKDEKPHKEASQRGLSDTELHPS